MSLLVAIVIWAVILSVVCWIISLIPLPGGAPPFLRNILYIAVAIVALMMLLDLVGWVDLGWHPVSVGRRR